MAHGYLTVADVLGMHAVLMQRYGGATGVRDPDAVEAALFRPQTGSMQAVRHRSKEKTAQRLPGVGSLVFIEATEYNHAPPLNAASRRKPWDQRWAWSR